MICTGDFIFTISYDKTARMWDFDTGECVRVFRGHKNNVTSLLFVPSDRDTMEAALDFIKIHAEKKNLEILMERPNHGGGGGGTNKTTGDIEIDETEIYSKDIIITGSLDNSARSWSIETGECVHTFRGRLTIILIISIIYKEMYDIKFLRKLSQKFFKSLKSFL
jgi:WD40 repeat protein